MTLLSIVKDAADAIGLPRPTAVYSSTDQQVRTLLALSNRGGKALLDRYPWSVAIREATFTSLAAELQGVVTTIAPGFKSLLNETIWNRSATRPAGGPVSPGQWQAYKAENIAGPWDRYRIQAGSLYIIPAPAAGQTFAFEYVSSYWCASSGGTGQAAWAADTDTGLLDEELLTLDLIWRFKQAKGLDYGEDFRTFEMRAVNAMGTDGGKARLSAAPDPDAFTRARAPAVPEGGWNL